MTRPSESNNGKAWIANFASIDQATATALLDGLRVVDLASLWGGIDSRLQSLRSEGEIAGPALVIPERSLKHFGVHGDARDTAVAFDDFAPGAPLSATPGSDGFVGMLLRDLERRSDDPEGLWIAPQAELKDLRERKCRWILIVTDYIGSGRQVTTFANALARNRTIRSWRSFGWVKVGVVAFAASPEAIGAVEAAASVDRAWTVEVAPTIETARWDETTRQAVIELCYREARGKRRDALGFGGTGGLFVTGRGAPNNLPRVFTQAAEEWQPLFPGRSVPSEFSAAVSNYQPTETLKKFAERIGQARFGRNDRVRDMRGNSRQLVAVLALAAKSPCTEVLIAQELGLKRAKAKILLQTLQGWGFVDVSGRLAADGKSELASHKRGRRRTTAFAQGDDRSTYYPQQLR